MDITAIGDGQFGIGLFCDFKYSPGKSGALVITAGKSGERPINVSTPRGVFLEVVDGTGTVIQDGGDGGWFYMQAMKKPVTLRYKSLPDPGLTKAQISKARRKTTVHVVDQERYDGGPINFGESYTDGSLNRVIKSFEKVRASIPVKYRDKARCEIDSESGYEGSHYAHVEITYERPETDAEVIERVKIERERSRIAERAERRQLDALQSKYSPTPDTQQGRG